ncbi:ATP-binding protein [Xylocopilactobacillus apicola]|uniref:Schlafen AlbA-2 domain-containing protein n=1 Tax=Xylocopilactobacillus apicola TaxID=2932184 RepID=A0AAU9D8I3_9LACO|nr:ATP-binding protein [Xylocopilactobacillus apicola]BDR57775.1 hypothetical protein XA3_02160 [Xylocopilactobacillus apicola]
MDTMELRRWVDLKEDDHHDFKQVWHSKEKNYELVKDIFSFVNTTHHDDCFLIFGVSDNQEVIGIENDENRRNQADLIDMINKLPISGDHKPKIRIETLKYAEHEIDVLRIINTNAVPIYLNQKWPKKGSKNYLTPGQIFMREGDRNVSIDGTAEYPKVEKLWQKHFRFDVPILERYSYVLQDVENWSYYENKEGYGFLYNLNPDFNMNLVRDDENRADIKPFSLNYIDCTISWSMLKVNYRQITIKELSVVWLDGGRVISVSPEVSQMKFSNDDSFYYYFIAGTMKGLIQKLFEFYNYSNKSLGAAPLAEFYESVVFFESESEMKNIEHIVSKNWDSISKEIEPTKEELKIIPDAVINNCRNQSLKPPKEVFAILLRQQKLAKEIKKILPIYRLKKDNK